MSRRQLRLGAFLYTPGSHSAGWRHPDAVPETDMDFAWYVRMARTAERGLIDTVFFQDTAAVNGSANLDGAGAIRPRVSRQVYLEPVSLIAALAAVTTHIGLISTATTTYSQPYDLARRFATIDHISGGRAGWNLVTSQIEDEAGNFGAERHMDHALRYERAEEFWDVVTALWDSWEDGALLRDKASGVYIDGDRLHFQHHEGRHFKVRGPLNLPRTPQGRPVISEAGSSEAGKRLAARTADLVFTAQTVLEEGRAFRDEVRALATGFARDPDDVKILPGLMTIVGRTEEEAQAKLAVLQSLISDEAAMRLLARLCGDLDIYAYDPDGPLPPLPPSNAAKARQQLIVDLARKEGLSIRQVARYLGTSLGHQLQVGTPAQIADRMQEWLEEGACDGFNLMFPHFPRPLEDFVELVVPELQRRGIYRTGYEGRTLRENLGIPVPANRYTRTGANSSGGGTSV
ncbi:LLM class flavin-dependent oxidoreductase [Belnapia rosea]|uniref:FMN-dependent oxidoreductase, nitrilotriacetate monooxygenase family n=1 Tax=Belnapia rosea TaxID=938405 RepID=A0A1G6TMI4_9PROT|nr:LLM class flavin-dependent oxidoreductase [Belnapia rosea]SDD29535.1 FMN-dependent oxidoreductase, nitrilotriacetate monooxygenase family [Belnapia rosea]